MNGDQKAPTPASGQPVYNPPSLTEPSGATPQPLPTLPTPQPAQPAAAPAPQAASPAAPVAPAAPTAPAEQPVTLAVAEPAEAPAAPAPAPAPVEAAEPVQAPTEQEPGFYHAGSSDDAAEGEAQSPAMSQADAPTVEWTTSGASFQVHAGNWRLRMAIFGLIGGLLVFLLTRSYFSSGAIIVAGFLFGILGSRAPRPISYRIDNRGISVGQKSFSFAEFRAFSVSDITPTINLVPLKRFSPIMVLRYDPTQAPDIVKALSSYLPMEAPRGNAVDGIVNRLKI